MIISQIKLQHVNPPSLQDQQMELNYNEKLHLHQFVDEAGVAHPEHQVTYAEQQQVTYAEQQQVQANVRMSECKADLS